MDKCATSKPSSDWRNVDATFCHRIQIWAFPLDGRLWPAELRCRKGTGFTLANGNFDVRRITCGVIDMLSFFTGCFFVLVPLSN